jgi:hypothetical protein
MKTKKELSYYRLRLETYLKDYHPHRLTDERFISERADMSAKIYEESFLAGATPDEAEETALQVLFEGLHFSEYFFIEQILDNEFSDEVPSELTPELSLLLLKNDAVKAAIAKYNPGDTFDEKPEYDRLYTELTGVILLVIENNSLLKSLKT